MIFLLSSNTYPLQRVTGGHLGPFLAGNEWEVGYSGRVFTLLKELAYTDRQQNITQAHRKPAISPTRTSLDCVKTGVWKDFHANPAHRPRPMWESNHHFSLLHRSVHYFTLSWFMQQTSGTEWLQVWTFQLAFLPKQVKNWSFEGDLERGFLRF